MSNIVPFRGRHSRRASPHIVELYAQLLRKARNAQHDPFIAPSLRIAYARLLCGHAIRNKGKIAC